MMIIETSREPICRSWITIHNNRPPRRSMRSVNVNRITYSNMARPRTNMTRWTVKGLSVGYIYPGRPRADGSRPAVIYIAHHSLPKTIRESINGLDFIPENRSIAEQILRDMVMPILFPELSRAKTRPDELRPVSLYELQRRFKEAQEQRNGPWTPDIKRHFGRATNWYYADLNVEAPIEFEEFRGAILARHHSARTRLAQNTHRKYFQYIMRQLEWAARMKLLPANPMEGIRTPDEILEEVRIFEWDDIKTILDYCRQRIGDEQGRRLRANQRTAKSFWLAYRLLSISGMRPIEIIRLRLTDVTDRLRVDGKRSAAAQPKIRELPLAIGQGLESTAIGAWIAELRSVLDDAIANALIHSETGYRNGYVFPWDQAASLTYDFKQVRMAVGRYDANLPMKNLRHTALERMESMGIDWLRICDWAGHNPSVRYKYYRQRLRAAAIGEAITRVARQQLLYQIGETE